MVQCGDQMDLLILMYVRMLMAKAVTQTHIMKELEQLLMQ